MKYIKAFVLLLAIPGFQAAAQDFGVNKKNCYAKRDSVMKQRFVDWECGKLVGVIDCNEKLEYDEGSNVLFSASSGKPFTGKCETCHQNGLLEHRINFVEGKEDGPDTTYYSTGCLMVIRNHIAGKETGTWTNYYDSTGKIAWEMNYLNGQKHGRQVYLNKKGDTSLVENYLNGVLHGVKKNYYSKSRVEKEAHYTNGLLDGLFVVYNAEGKPLQQVNYKNGKKDGVATYYYDDGVLLRTENWSMDARNGEFKTVYYQQTIQSIESYKKNKNYKEEKMDADVFECASQQIADQVYKLLTKDHLNPTQLVEKLKPDTVKITKNQYNVEATPFLKFKKKFNIGVNEPYAFEGKFYVVVNKKIITNVPVDIKEGWFEERYPENKLKRKALYRNNVLVEDHVFNEQGKEIYTFGASSYKATEDDAAPVDNKTKKEKAKKEKKPKEPKQK